MESLDKYIFTVKRLNEYLLKKENVVIYGAGDYGRRLIDYIIKKKESKRIKRIIVTQVDKEYSDYRGIEIQEAIPFLEKCETCYVIVAVSMVYQSDIIKIINKYGHQYRCITSDVYEDIGNDLNNKVVRYSGINFLCAGFGKCGTTSLHSVLNKMDNIYLPERKETFFFTWYNDTKEPKKILSERYFNGIREGQIVGMIEPTFSRCAEQVYEFFGSNMKIIFLVRNPADAIFSLFKMLCRDGDRRLDEAYYSRGRFSVDFFDEFLKKEENKWDIATREYIYRIEEYKKYFSKDQIKIVIFEELANNPKEQINSILEFIGIPDRYEDETLPLENEGNFVMANEKGHKIAQLSSDLFRAELPLSLEQIRRRAYEGRKREYIEVMEKYDQAEKIFNVEMTPKQRRKAEDYYAPSVRKLENIINKDLSVLWF